MIERLLDGAELLILDNLSCLCRSGVENEAESWIPVAEFALRLRRSGVSVLFVHHSGKSGAQRGTSKREDLLDSVIALKRPEDYSAEEGLRVQVVYEKARGFFGNDATPFELRLVMEESGAARWEVSDTEVSKRVEAKTLFEQGKSIREVAAALDISKSAAHRLKERIGL
jgi:putative DNA primase/helicase